LCGLDTNRVMRTTHSDFRRSAAYRSLSAGTFSISYTDSTHLSEGEWIPLLEINLLDDRLGGLSSDGERYYTARCSVPAQLDQLTPEHRRILIDVLSFSLSRTGLVNPILGQSTYREVE